jgi:tubulin beta
MKTAQNSGDASVNWVPKNITTSVCPVQPCGLETASTFVGNTTAIKQPLEHIIQQFNAMFKRKAYLPGYMMAAGAMEEMEFTEAAANVSELIAEYEQSEEGNP